MYKFNISRNVKNIKLKNKYFLTLCTFYKIFMKH